MKLTADFHTHTRYSRFNHGKDTIEEMVYQANELGLKELAITDHGYKNFFGTTKEKMKRARKVIDDINAWSKTKVLLGIEANLLNTSGEIDVDEETLELIDILIVGYHRMIKTDFANIFGGQKKSQTAIDKATNAYIHAIENYPITILSHLDSVLTTDLYRIGCACKENGVMVEINNRHLTWTKEQVEALKKSGCMFVVNSDAHCRDDIAVVNKAIKFIKEHKIPSQNIANMEFTEEEMTAEDLEAQIYYDFYQQRVDEQKERMKKGSEKYGGAVLSKEMEDALEQLAREQGDENYQRFDKELTQDDILNDETYLRETELAVNDLRSMLETQNRLSKGEEVYSEYSGDEYVEEETSSDVQTYESVEQDVEIYGDEQKSNVRETVEFNETGENINTFVNTGNGFYSSQGFVSNVSNFGNSQVVRDSDYQNNNSQEEQIEYFKNNSEEDAVVDNDTTKGELRQSFDNFFEDTVDSSNFNVKKDYENYSPEDNYYQSGRNIHTNGNVKIQRNYEGTQNNSVENSNNSQSSQNTNRVRKNIGAGNFYSETGSVLGVQVNHNTPQENKTIQKPKQNTQRPTRLGNGLIDFSSLTDDED
ncbi:MAG: PHP domain-containing protein [Clostridia bacterium]|nr:PHP domain-containing protein [Clostridia bacterium]